MERQTFRDRAIYQDDERVITVETTKHGVLIEAWAVDPDGNDIFIGQFERSADELYKLIINSLR